MVCGMGSLGVRKKRLPQNAGKTIVLKHDFTEDPFIMGRGDVKFKSDQPKKLPFQNVHFFVGNWADRVSDNVGGRG
jgi:hypothetical protein